MDFGLAMRVSLEVGVGDLYLDDLLGVREEDIEVARVEALASSLFHHHKALLSGERGLVGSLAAQRVEDVGDRGDSPFDREVFAGQGERLAATIPLLVVRRAMLLAILRSGVSSTT